MNNINAINNIYFNQIYSPHLQTNSNLTWEKPIDNSNININNINKLIDLLIKQYLNNINQINNNTNQGNSFNNFSQDELSKLLLLLLQYLNSINPNGNTFSPSDNSYPSGNFGNPQITTPSNNIAPINPNTRSDKSYIPSASNSTPSNSSATPASNNSPSTSNITPASSNSPSTSNITTASNNSPSTSNTTPVNSGNKIDLNAYPPEEREKIQRFLDRANDALNNPEKYRNPNNGKTAKDGSQWDMWCLGFVNNMAEYKDSALRAPSAKESLQIIKEQGRLRTDWDNMPPGSYLYWGNGQYGHIAIYTGERNEKGEPMIITTGWNGFNGLHKVPLSELQRRLGNPEGFATPKLS